MAEMVRTLVAKRLLDNITALALTASDGSVLPILDHIPSGAPSDMVPREFIALGELDGQAELTHMKAGAKSYQDVYDLDIVVQARGPGSLSFAARQRVSVLTQAVIECVRADAALTTPTGIDGHAFVQLGAIKGPNAWPLDTKDGWAAEAVLTLSCTAHKLA